jgi:hypothetical protein
VIERAELFAAVMSPVVARNRRVRLSRNCLLLGGYCCKSRFAEGVKNYEDYWRVVGVMI